MCGRAKLETDVSEIKIAFRIPPEYPTPNFPPSWNVAPTDNLPIVRYDAKAGSRTLDLMRWGLVPYWSKDLKIGFSTINAMAETVDKKPVFREAFQRRRCIVPLLRMEEARRQDQAALRDCACRSVVDGVGRALGDLEVTSQRDDPLIHDRYDEAERTLWRASQSNARRIAARDMAALGGRGTGELGSIKVAARVLSRRHDVLAGKPARRQRQKQRPEPHRACGLRSHMLASRTPMMPFAGLRLRAVIHQRLR